MQLVMTRQRLDSVNSWHSFHINARMVLDGDEDELIKKYRLRGVILTPGNTARDIRRAVWISVFCSVLLFALLNAFSQMRIGSIILTTIIAFGIIAYLIYEQIRETVYVNDLMNGRDFKARSLVQLLVKEQQIRKMSGVFAIVIEQARTWHEPEVIQVEPQPLGITLAPTPEGSYEVT